MALIAMATFDTPDNGRATLTAQTLICLHNTVDLRRHRLVVIDNGSTCERTREILAALDPRYPVFGEWASWMGTLPRATVIRNAENRGTARAVNQGWLLAEPGASRVKMDNDVLIHQNGWLDLLEECVARDPQLGIVGLKRKDLDERPAYLKPSHPWYESELYMLPQEKGQRWLVVEKAKHVMGTCQLYSPALLEKIGFLYPSGRYAFDDSDAGIRCRLAGFYSAFLVGVEIDHLDPGATEFTTWKQEEAGRQQAAYERTCREYVAGTRSIYRGPDEE
jgi:GT2 family glycosyltransferase